MRRKIPRTVIDISGVKLRPGKPNVCRGNGKRGYECCCDECDYVLLCFPEFDTEAPKKQPKRKRKKFL